MDDDHVIWSKSISRIRIPDSKLVFSIFTFLPFLNKPEFSDWDKLVVEKNKKKCKILKLYFVLLFTIPLTFKLFKWSP